ncbi:MAG: hypothetical protein WBG86_19140 [Polyangiales bacterium]
MDFLRSGLGDFARHHEDVSIGHVALYCCPWSGWTSLCLNRAVQLDQNCPDFDYFEHALYHAPNWATQYESERRLEVATLRGEHVSIDVDIEGDEALNAVFAAFLKAILTEPSSAQAIQDAAGPGVRVGAQLIDT